MTENITENKGTVTFNFIISAYHVVQNIEESVEDTFSHKGKIGGLEEAQTLAIDAAKNKWPEESGYYAHHAA